MIDKIKKELTKRFEQANWGTITINMKCNGDTVTLTPDASDNNYIFIHSDSVPNLPCGSLDKVAHVIMDYKDYVTRHQKDIADIHAYCEKHANDNYDSDAYDFFSDWHKDIFGFRPNGWMVASY